MVDFPQAPWEAKLHAFRKTQDGVVVSFVIHPAEVPRALALDELGTRYGMALARIEPDGAADAPQEPAPAEKPHRKWNKLSRREQAVLACKREDFQEWICGLEMLSMSENNAVVAVYDHTDCGSRRDLDEIGACAAKWDALWLRFEQETGRVAEVR